jgi:hypothetical protein
LLREGIAIRNDSPRWTEINASAWPHERAGPRHVTILLPVADPDFAWANVEFVRWALARDTANWLDMIEEMADAWRLIFKDIAPAGPAESLPVEPPHAVTRDTPVDLVGLTALEHFGGPSGNHVGTRY